MAHVEIANYPFTTIDANHGVAYIRTTCPCRDLGLVCNECVDGVRFIQVGLIDVAGLVPEAHKGRGLGNQFLDHLRQADAILHIIDASGSTDSEGNPVDPGSHNPVQDIGFISREMTMWAYGILEKHWPKIHRSAQQKSFSVIDAVADVYAGLGITYEQIRDAEQEACINLRQAGEDDLIAFCETLICRSKPMYIVANKADLMPDQIARDLSHEPVSFASAAGELALRKAAEGRFITYVAGDTDFIISPAAKLSEAQKHGLETIRQFMEQNSGTGVQKAINTAVFELLDMIVVYPVEDENKYCDGQGRVLPDAFLMKRGSTPHDLAYRIHSDIGDGFLYAVDAQSKMRIRENHELRHGDIIKIVSTRR